MPCTRACGAWNLQKELHSAKPRISRTHASPSSELTPRRNYFPARMRSARVFESTVSYQIVGVLKHVINNSDDNLNEHIYVPFSTMNELKDTFYLNSIVMEYEGDNAKVVKALRNSM